MDRDNRVPMKMGEFSVMDTEFDNIRDRWVDNIMFCRLWVVNVIVQVWLRDEEDGGGDEQVPERADQQTGRHLQEDIHQVPEKIIAFNTRKAAFTLTKENP